MVIRFHPHAKERMKERGTTEDEVKATVEQGEQFSAKFNRTGLDVTFCLIVSGVEGITKSNRWKFMLLKKILTG